MIKEKIDYVEQDIYDYFGADQDIYKATRHDLLGVIGGMSGILELLWHKEVTPEIAFKDFKSWLKERQEHDDLLDITEKIPDTNIPIKKERNPMPKKILNAEDVDFVYIENITFGVVMKDDNGTELTVSESEIQMDSFSREQLADNVLAHIQQGRPVDIIDENEDIITFEPDMDLTERR